MAIKKKPVKKPKAKPAKNSYVAASAKPTKTEQTKLLDEAKSNYKLAEEAWSDNRKQAIEDMKFRALQQWPDKIREIREKANRPVLVVDKLNQYIRQVVNDGRQNRPSVKVRPIDDDGDSEVAQAYEGIIRHILYLSNADAAFDTALDCAVANGFGWIRVLADYSYEGTFDQDLKVVRVRNPVSIFIDPNAQEPDGSDATYGFVIDEISKEEFKRRWPKAKVTDWNDSRFNDGWRQDNNIRVAEYWYKVETPQNLLLLADGTTVTEAEYAESKADGAQVAPIQDQRTIMVPVVKWCRLTGAEILEERDWKGKYIPIIPVYGNEWDIEGKVVYSGLVRAAKDAQRLYNFARSAFAERVALTPKAPWIAANGQVQEYLADWESSIVENIAVLKYDPQDVAGTPVPPPQRVSPTDVPSGSAQDMQIAEHDIQASMGIYQANIGAPSNETSGKAITARQREGDTATFHYMDNLNRAIRHLGRILVDLIPHYYGARKVIRILGEDGDASEAQTNDELGQAVLKNGPQVIYNLGVGEYDVAIDSGPSYMTKRMEMADTMGQIAQGNPQLFMLIADLWAKAQDWPNADKIATRFKAMLPPPVQQAEAAQEAGQDPEVAQVQQQAQQVIGGLQQQLQGAVQGIQQRDHAIGQLQGQIEALRKQVLVKGADVEVKNKQADTQQYQAETQRAQALQPAFALDPQGLAQMVHQLVADAMQTHLTNAPPQLPPAQLPQAPPQQQMPQPPQQPQPQQPQAPQGAS